MTIMICKSTQGWAKRRERGRLREGTKCIVARGGFCRKEMPRTELIMRIISSNLWLRVPTLIGKRNAPGEINLEKKKIQKNQPRVFSPVKEFSQPFKILITSFCAIIDCVETNFLSVWKHCWRKIRMFDFAEKRFSFVQILLAAIACHRKMALTELIRYNEKGYISDQVFKTCFLNWEQNQALE